MSRQDEFRRDRSEEWHGQRVSEWDDEERRRRFGERDDQERYRREYEQEARAAEERRRRERDPWRTQGGRDPGRESWRERDRYEGREHFGREDDRRREGTWRGESGGSLGQRDYPESGRSRESWPQGGHGQQGYGREPWTREDYGREQFGRGGAGSYGTGYESESFGGSMGRGWQKQDEPRGWQGQPSPRGAWQGSAGGFYGGQQAQSPGWGSSYDPRYGGSHGGGYRESFFGRGPSNYQRSDERIREDLCERLTDHPGIDATHVEVEVRDREVTLRGEVEDRDQKRMLEDVVEYVPGVRDVHNHVKSRQGGFFSRLFGGGDRDRDRERDRAYPASSMGTEYSTGQGTTLRGMAGSRSMPNTGTAGIGAETARGTATGDTSRIREGMEVNGANGQRIGRVKEIRGSEFVLDRPRRKDLLVPRTAVSEVTEVIVVLRHNADEIDDLGWDRTMMESGQEQRR